MMNEKQEPVADNAAKMREALESVDDAFSSGSLYAPGDCPTPHDVSVFEDVRDKVKTALATPPRNCDVGTAEEQAQRFYKFCMANSSAIRGMCDSKCPCIDSGDKCHCLTKWAQMPYKSKEGSKE